jgi:hypothetical protein
LTAEQEEGEHGQTTGIAVHSQMRRHFARKILQDEFSQSSRVLFRGPI